MRKYCSIHLRADGLPYPKTCARCGLGPCQTAIQAGPRGDAVPMAPPTGGDPDFDEVETPPKKDDGGRAQHPDMTLRDRFALQALVAFAPMEWSPATRAEMAYEVADAMLKARKA